MEITNIQYPITNIQEKYDALEKESNRHYEQMKANYEDVIEEKDTRIMAQRKAMDDYYIYCRQTMVEYHVERY